MLSLRKCSKAQRVTHARIVAMRYCVHAIYILARWLLTKRRESAGLLVRMSWPTVETASVQLAQLYIRTER